MAPTDRRRFLLDTGVALALFVGLLAIMRLHFGVLSAPGYVVMLGFDAIQNPLAPGLGGGAFEVAFGGYVLGLALLGGRIGGRLRRRFGPGGRLRYGLAGGVLGFVLYALVVVGAMAVGALSPGVAPVAIAVVVGLLGLWTGMRLADQRATSKNGA